MGAQPAGNNEPFLVSLTNPKLSGRYNCFEGTIERGTVHVNDAVEVFVDGVFKTGIIKEMERFRKLLDWAQAGDVVEITIQSSEDIRGGSFLVFPGSASPMHQKFEAEMHLLTQEEGGRSHPIFSGFLSQVQLIAPVTGSLKILDKEELNPGESGTVAIELIYRMPMEIGQTFSIKNGPKTIGSGSITKIVR